MANGWTEEVSGTRRVVITHSNGHRFFFEFPEGWEGGHLLLYKPVVWANGEKPDTPWLEAEAAIMGVSARAGYLVEPGRRSTGLDRGCELLSGVSGGRFDR